MSSMSRQFVQKAISNPFCNQHCYQLHEHSCISRAFINFAIASKSFTKLYLLFFIMHLLISKRNKLLNNPSSVFKKFMSSFAKSLLFGGGYLGLQRAAGCIIGNIYYYNDFATITSATFGGLSLIAEAPERQPQIAMFILTNGLQLLYNMAIRRKYPINIPNGQYLYFSLGISLLCYHFFNNKNLIKGSYLQMMDKLFDNI